MGFFDKLLSGLGFETDDKPKKIKKKSDVKSKTGEFSFDENASDTLEMKPKNQEEVSKCVDLLRKEGSIVVDLSRFEDINIPLAFLSGAAYAFGGEITKINNSTYKLKVE